MSTHKTDDDEARDGNGRVVTVPLLMMDSVQREVASVGDVLAPHERRLVDHAVLADHYGRIGAQHGGNANGYALDASPAADAAAVQRAEDARAAYIQRAKDRCKGDADPMAEHPWNAERAEKIRKRREEEARAAAAKGQGGGEKDAAAKALAARDARLANAWRGNAAA